MSDATRSFETMHVGVRVPYKSVGQVTEEAKLLRRVIESNCPPGRAKSLAFTKLEECVMWAKASFEQEEEV